MEIREFYTYAEVYKLLGSAVDMLFLPLCTMHIYMYIYMNVLHIHLYTYLKYNI